MLSGNEAQSTLPDDSYSDTTGRPQISSFIILIEPDVSCTACNKVGVGGFVLLLRQYMQLLFKRLHFVLEVNDIVPRYFLAFSLYDEFSTLCQTG